MITVHATKKLLDRLPGGAVGDLQPSTAALGAWYATVLFWRPRVVLFVNEPTRLPLLVPFAPAASVLARLPQVAAEMFGALGLPHDFVGREITAMHRCQLAKTANRSVVGSMNEFAFLADAYREPGQPVDLVPLSLELARTPCGPLYRSHVSPDREIRSYVTNLPP